MMTTLQGARTDLDYLEITYPVIFYQIGYEPLQGYQPNYHKVLCNEINNTYKSIVYSQC